MIAPGMDRGASTPRRGSTKATKAPPSATALKQRAIRAEVAAAARAIYLNAPGKADAIRWLMNVALNEGGVVDGIEDRVMPRDRRTVQRAIAEAVSRGWLYPQEALAHDGRKQRWIVDWQAFVAEGVELARAQRVKNRVKRDERVAAIRLKFEAFRAANEALRGRQADAPTERTPPSEERTPDPRPATVPAPAVAVASPCARSEVPPDAEPAEVSFSSVKEESPAVGAERREGLRQRRESPHEGSVEPGAARAPAPARQTVPALNGRWSWSRQEAAALAALRSTSRHAVKASEPATPTERANLEATTLRRRWREVEAETAARLEAARLADAADAEQRRVERKEAAAEWTELAQWKAARRAGHKITFGQWKAGVRPNAGGEVAPTPAATPTGSTTTREAA